MKILSVFGTRPEGLARADVALMLVDHDAFRATPIPTSKGVRVIDTRGVWSERRSG